MNTVNADTTLDAKIAEGVRQQLEGLKRTPGGAMLYKLIERGLAQYDHGGRIEQAFLTFLNSLLLKYVQDPTADAATRFKARLILQRLALNVPRPVATPKVAATNGAAVDAPPTQSRAKSATATPAPTPATMAFAATVPPSEFVPAPGPAPAVTMTAIEPAPVPAATVAHAERRLAHEVMTTITHNREFDRLLENNVAELRKIGSSGELDDLERVFLQGMEQLVQGQRALSENLQRTSSALKALQDDRQRLRSQLDKATASAMVDPLTGLATRAALMRQLEAEIGRARRYGFALALAVMDVDGFAEFNARFGRSAGDQVLTCYARDVLSQFRSYDVVARFAGDEFVALFPNTQKDGAVRALDKARQQVANTVIHVNGHDIALPGFSSVLTLYVHGEHPEALLARAQEVLRQSKTKGGNQAVVALRAQ